MVSLKRNKIISIDNNAIALTIKGTIYVNLQGQFIIHPFCVNLWGFLNWVFNTGIMKKVFGAIKKNILIKKDSIWVIKIWIKIKILRTYEIKIRKKIWKPYKMIQMWNKNKLLFQIIVRIMKVFRIKLIKTIKRSKSKVTIKGNLVVLKKNKPRIEWMKLVNKQSIKKGYWLKILKINKSKDKLNLLKRTKNILFNNHKQSEKVKRRNNKVWFLIQILWKRIKIKSFSLRNLKMYHLSKDWVETKKKFNINKSCHQQIL